jgi:hypothetical protein
MLGALLYADARHMGHDPHVDAGVDASVGAGMLALLLIAASFVAGLVKAPWWFWLLAGVTLAVLTATDPSRARMSYAEVRGFNTMLFSDLGLLARSCLLAAAAFAGGMWTAGVVTIY